MEEHQGLGFQVVPLIVDPRFAPRGEQHTNAYQEHLLRAQRDDGWEDFRDPDDDDGEPTSVININTEIPETNVGFKLLQKMGWSKGKGLGKNETGITEPIRAGVDAGVRLGLGKQAQDDHYTNAELIERRKLETEIQAEEDEDRRQKREALAEREQKIKEEVTQIKKTFYCDVCHKQYEKAMEFEQHLDSYDHHHKKRLAELRVMNAERTREDRARKEAKAMEKDMAKLQQQILRAQQQQQRQGPPSTDVIPPPPPAPSQAGPTGSWGGAAPPPPPPLPAGPPPPPVPADAPPPPPPPDPNPQAGTGSVGALSISLGKSIGGGRTGPGAGLRGRGVGRGGLAAGRGRGQVLSGFGCSSSDEDEAPK